MVRPKNTVEWDQPIVQLHHSIDFGLRRSAVSHIGASEYRLGQVQTGLVFQLDRKSQVYRQQPILIPELSGGAGFNYEDLVVGYYLEALLSDGPSAGVPGAVRSVAVQQAAVHSMDDLVLEFEG